MRIFCGIPTAAATLHFYGAAGIACLGWALARLLHFGNAHDIAILFAGALLIYNIDRLKPDPADAINVPGRSENSARLQRASLVVAAVSACALAAIPLVMRDWLLLLLTGAGAFVCVNYSVPVFGFRLKDVPLLKTFFAPGAVAVACLALPLMQQGLRVPAAHFAIASAWTFAFLFFNMTLCDLRDIAGDRANGTISVPVFLGKKITMRLLAVLVILLAALAFAGARTAPRQEAARWLLLAVAATVYPGGLLVALKKPRTESFHAWWVEGMLFVPALAVVATA